MHGSCDIGGLLVSELSSRGFGISASEVPRDLAGRLPHVHVVATGGVAAGFVQEWRYCDMDVYACGYAEAHETASRLSAAVRDLDGGAVGPAVCYRASVATPAYDNPDPDHPTLPRVTLKAQFLMRLS